VALAAGNATRPVLSGRTARQRRIPWIQLNIPGCAADLATGGAAGARLKAVMKSANQPPGGWAGRQVGETGKGR